MKSYPAKFESFQLKIVQMGETQKLQNLMPYIRLVFTSDGVIVGVVIRSVKRYDLVKIKPTESEAEH